ncbi:MAG TPA: SRPBCC family protein [Acidimicrobiia bacterium]|nr:SRPBCC family protein [Acidimicrobiia bacterium]
MDVTPGPLTAPTHEASIEIAAPPEEVWPLVADVTRMAQLSPVCRRNEWLGEPAKPVVGARFRGHNRNGVFRWSRECTVTEAEPGRRFAFSTLFKGAESTRWRYTFEPTADGTRVTEAYEVVSVPRWLRILWRLPGARAKSERDHVANIAGMLDHLKAAAESPTA